MGIKNEKKNQVQPLVLKEQIQLKSSKKSVLNQVLKENSVRPDQDADNGKKLVKKRVAVGIHLHQGQDQDSYGKIIASKKLKNEQLSQFHSSKLMKLTKNTLQPTNVMSQWQTERNAQPVKAQQ